MIFGRSRAVAILVISTFLLMGTGFLAASQPASANTDVSAKGAELDRRLTEAYLRKDWTALEKFIAPDYAGFTPDEHWDFAGLKREFAKILMTDFHVERQQVRGISPDMILVNDVLTMKESYAGQDISGRYWTSDVWVRRNGKWLLLVEQEVPLK